MLHTMFLLLQATAAGPAIEAPAPRTPPLANAEAYRATAPRLTSTITIDGVLDEPAWSTAAPLTGFHQYQPVDGRPAEEETTVLVWYAPDAIYFGIRAQDNDPQAIHATRAQRDRLDAEDRITIYLDTFDDRRRAYFFTVNPLGIQEDGIRSEGGFTAATLLGGTMDKNPDFVWQSRGQVTPGRLRRRNPDSLQEHPLRRRRPAAVGPQRRADDPAHRLPGHLDRHPPGQRLVPGPERHPRRPARHAPGHRHRDPARSDRGSRRVQGLERDLLAERRGPLAWRQRPPGLEQQHHPLGHLQPRLQPDRVGRGPGDA